MGECKPVDFKSVQDRYKKGDRVAGYMLGTYYQQGYDVKKNEERASSIFVDLAEKGHWGSKGECHEYGYGPYLKSDEKAVECYRKGVEEEDEVSLMALARCYLQGTGVDKDVEKGLALLSQAADKGFARALYLLGAFYLQGIAMDKDKEKGMTLLSQAVERGEPHAIGWLCKRLEEDSGVDIDIERAVALLNQAADKGDVGAISTLASCYYYGKNVDEDFHRGIALYRQAIEKGLKPAYGNLGGCYNDDIGVDKDGVKAIECAKQQQQEEEEEVKPRQAVSSLFESCTSDVDMIKMEDRLLPPSSSSPLTRDGEEGEIGRSTRHLADALLRSLDSRAAGVTSSSSEDKHTSEKEEMDDAVANLLTVAAGMTSTVSDTHDRVQSAIDTLADQLPDLKKMSKQRQAVLKALLGVTEKEEKESEEADKGGAARQKEDTDDPSPLDRASALSKLLQPDCADSLTSVRILRKMRERVSESISKMKADMSRAEEKARSEYEREHKHEYDSAAYLISMNKQYAEKSKAALPHLLTMSDHLGVDLLHLSGSALSTVFDMKEMSSLKSEYEAALDMLRRCKSHIENKEKGEEALAVRCPSGLASLLSGRVPSGIDERPANVTLFDITSHFARLPSSSACSDWHSSLTEAWSWLECKYSEWSDLESRCDHALSHSDDLTELSTIVKELKVSGMDVRDRVANFSEKMNNIMMDE